MPFYVPLLTTSSVSFDSVTTGVTNILTVVTTMITTIFTNPITAAMAVSGFIFVGLRVWRKLKRG